MTTLIVVAIDIGYSFSGCTFQTKSEFQLRPEYFYSTVTETIRNVGNRNPTCILFDPQQEFNSFGYKAEEKYQELNSEGLGNEWYFFKNFKRETYEKIVSEQTLEVEDATGKRLPAEMVWTSTLKYFKMDLMKSFHPAGIFENDVQWVITIPAMSTEKSIMFMQTCAEKAGFNREKVLTVFDYHAASMFVKYDRSCSTDKRQGCSFDVGSKYLVCDAGGGSVDCTVFKVRNEGSILQLMTDTNSEIAGFMFDRLISKFLERLSGHHAVTEFRNDYSDSFNELCRDIKIKMESEQSEKRVALQFGSLVIDIHNKYNPNLSLTEAIEKNFRKKVFHRADKLFFEKSFLQELFEESVFKIIEYLKKTLRHSSARDIQSIICVGGMFKNGILREMLTSVIEKRIRVIFLKDPELVVMKGAVLYGHNPSITEERIAMYTIACRCVFTEENDDTSYIFDESEPFEKLVEIGTPVAVGKPHLTRTYSSMNNYNKVSVFFYSSAEKDLQTVDDDTCDYIGNVTLNISPSNNSDAHMQLTFAGPAIEVKLECCDVKSRGLLFLSPSKTDQSKDYLLVGAVDFGTTYSGYAFSPRSDYLENPTIIQTKKYSTSSQLQSLKTSTCALFKPDGKFHSFGYDAEDKFAELVQEDEHEGWYFFQRFKMKLYNEMSLENSFMLESETGHKLPAWKIFTSVIRHLKNEMLEEIRLKNAGVHEYEMRWVITVPAIWTDSSKSFMRECAVRAGMDDENLVIALEPEAAAIYANLCAMNSSKSDEDSMGTVQPQTKYLICDAGGGTVDVTVHEVLDNKGNVRELLKASGGDWGGTKVDEEFFELLERIAGEKAMKEFTKDNPDDVLNLLREFEVKKRSFSSKTDSKSIFNLPASFMELFLRYNKNKSLQMRISEMKTVANNLQVKANKLKISPTLFREFFNRSIENICRHLQDIFKHPEAKDVDSILLVGGYSESPMLREAVGKYFPLKTIKIPKEPELSVLKGAVIFGHNPLLIKERIAKYTYGVLCSTPFVAGLHCEEYKFMKNGDLYCDNLFDRHVKKGSVLKVGQYQSTHTYSKGVNEDKIRIAVYASTKENPRYVTEEECFSLGEKIISFQNGKSLGASKIEIQMSFSGTEIELKMTCKATGNITFMHLCDYF